VASFTDDTAQAVSATSTPTAAVVDVAPKLTVSVTGNAIEGSVLTATSHATSHDWWNDHLSMARADRDDVDKHYGRDGRDLHSSGGRRRPSAPGGGNLHG